MKDWKGNEVRAGDTFMWVRVKDDRAPITSTLFVIQRDSTEPTGFKVSAIGTPIALTPPSCKYVWEVVSEHNVREHRVLGHAYLAYEKFYGAMKYIIPLDSFFLSNNHTSNYILCIKGKSDNELEYYQHVFST